LELRRQTFDEKARVWKKLVNKVTLDDFITIRDTLYRLHGFIAHEESVQSGLYYPVLRPDPNGKWYSYSPMKDEHGNSRDQHKVTCVTKRWAIQHEGSVSASGKERDPVAYIVQYVRQDVVDRATQSEEPAWSVPEWILQDMKTTSDYGANDKSMLLDPSKANLTAINGQNGDVLADAKAAKILQYQVINSHAFMDHEGPGTLDVFESKWMEKDNPFTFNIKLLAIDTPQDIRRKLFEAIPKIEDERQIRFWVMDSQRASRLQPSLHASGTTEFSGGTLENYERWTMEELDLRGPERRLWLHVIDVKDLPELPKQPEMNGAVSLSSPAPAPSSNPTSTLSNPPPAEEAANDGTHSPEAEEDTSMSDAEIDDDGILADAEGSANDETGRAIAREIMMASAPTGNAVRQNGPADLLLELAAASSDQDGPIGHAQLDDMERRALQLLNSATRIADNDVEMGGTIHRLPEPINSDISPGLVEGSNLLFASRRTVFDNGMDSPTIVDLSAPPPPPPLAVPNYSEIYFFLKFFDVDAQKLIAKGSFIAKGTSRIDTTVMKLLGCEKGAEMDLYVEGVGGNAHPIRRRKTFNMGGHIQNASILIASPPISESRAASLAADAKFSTPKAYLAYCSDRLNFPHLCDGHFTLDYFSGEYYEGEMRNKQFHGQGKRIYHDNSSYTGPFTLSTRHGEDGQMTYPNGDVYRGAWRLDSPHGHGTLVEAASGNEYEGGWRAGKRFGEGVTRWRQAQEVERLCRICWDGEADAAFYDCGHVVACLACARRVDSCPVCRKRVLTALKLWWGN